MGSTKPKPDYTAGLLSTAFTGEEITRLENYTQPTKPFQLTPDVCFPFLICETKTGERGMNEADRQNIHSASIAVRAIIELYREAFGQKAPDRVHELYGQVLVFTVSHNNDRVFLYGHFAIAEHDFIGELKFYRYLIALLSLTARGGADSHRAYNFVRNVYEKFAPDHRKRIKDAVAELPKPHQRTTLSFSASNMTLDETTSESDSQNTPSQGDGAFQKPGEPASASQKKKVNKSKRQTEQQMRQINKLLQQLEQQREPMEQQRKDSREKEERMERQMQQQLEQQRKQMESQLQQQKEIISLLKAPKRS